MNTYGVKSLWYIINLTAFKTTVTLVRIVGGEKGENYGQM